MELCLLIPTIIVLTTNVNLFYYGDAISKLNIIHDIVIKAAMPLFFSNPPGAKITMFGEQSPVQYLELKLKKNYSKIKVCIQQ